MTKAQRPPVEAPKHTLSAEFLHHLRTPLNQIIGYSEMLTEQAREEGQTGFVPDLHRIHKAGRQLLTLLNTGVPMRTEETPQAGNPKIAVSRDAPPLEGTSGTTEEQPTTDASQALILVVDDNSANRDMLSRRLERQGHRVALAENGREAMEVVQTQSFDLVLLDIMMPEIDGYTVLQQLKADEALRHIPVIMISALDEMESVVRCIQMGAEDYLPKPFDPTLLKARIGACLDKKRAHDREIRLYQQLQQSYGRLQELEKMRDDMTHMIIHDLRTPLTAVIMGMQTLEVTGDLNEDQQEMRDIALQGGENLLGLINDLLDISKMESGSMPLDESTLSAAELVAGAVGQIERLAKSHQLTVVQQISAGLPRFQGDETKLRRTLVNLLGNAIKFTPESGILTIGVQFGENRKSLVFSVRDTGEGIPSEAFERIFEKFGQVESREGGRLMSTGLGLTFCKLAVEAHGGRIKVDSIQGKGSIFSFTIPLTTGALSSGARKQKGKAA